jgi:hypothetical protein
METTIDELPSRKYTQAETWLNYVIITWYCIWVLVIPPSLGNYITSRCMYIYCIYIYCFMDRLAYIYIYSYHLYLYSYIGYMNLCILISIFTEWRSFTTSMDVTMRFTWIHLDSLWRSEIFSY